MRRLFKKRKWKVIFLAVCTALSALLYVACMPLETSQTEYFRIHIRANSNTASDQAVKQEVRVAVVDYLTPILKNAGTFEKAVAAAQKVLNKIVGVSQAALATNGMSYGARARVAEEDFPTRDYEGMRLPAGKYTALVIELGEGKGDNWWCVAYPALCFGGDDITVRSKILDWIRSLAA